MSNGLVSPLGNYPNDWKIVHLRDITTKIGSGATPSGGRDTYLCHREDFALVRSQNVLDRKFDERGLAYLTDKQASDLLGVSLIKDDILLNITGDGITFSRACIVPDRILPAVVNQHVSIIRVDKSQADSGYILSYLTHPSIKKYIESFNAGGSRRAITKGHIESFVIPLPPLPIQHVIARILGSLDDKIELNSRMNETLEAMARAIFQSWFVDFDPVWAKAEGRNTGLPLETAALFPDGFEEIEGREVPRGWGVGTVQDLCDSIENGGTPKRMESSYWVEGTIPWFKTGELSDDPLIDSDEKISELGLTESACRLWQPKTILIALYASPTVGRLGILEIPGTANQACSALVAKPAFGFLFLYYSLLFSRDQLQNIAVGAAQQNINQQVLKEHQILIPDVCVAQKFQLIIERLYGKKVNNIQQSRTLAQIRDALLAKLMSGELRVENIQSNAVTM